MSLKTWLHLLPFEHPLLADAFDILIWFVTFEWLRGER